MKRHTILGALGTLAAVTLSLVTGAGDAHAADPGTVDIRLEVTSGADTAVYEVLGSDVTAVQNLSGGNLIGVDHGITALFVVDFDAANQQIRVYPLGGCFDGLKLTITNSDLSGHEVALLTDMTWDGAVPAITIDQPTDETVVITWTAESCVQFYQSGTADFGFSAPRQIPTTTTVADLPHTGSHGSLTLFATAFLAVGTTTVVAARRRHT